MRAPAHRHPVRAGTWPRTDVAEEHEHPIIPRDPVSGTAEWVGGRHVHDLPPSRPGETGLPR